MVFQGLYQFLGDIWTFQPHDAFLCTPVAEKIDAAVPHDFLVDDCKFLTQIRQLMKKSFGLSIS